MPDLNNDQALDTQDLDQQQPDGDQNTSGDSGSDDGDFLTVNERTRYKTREDALRGFTEAQTRITSLSQWEKVAKQYGLTDPAQINQVVRELLDLRKSAQAGKTAASDASQQPTGKTHSDDDLSAEDQAALKWLQKMAPRLGYVPKADLDKTVAELKAQVDELKGGQQSTEEQARNAAIDHGSSELTKLMTDAKLPTDEDARGAFETLIRAWIEADESNELRARFFASPSERAAVVKEGFEQVRKTFGKFTGGSSPASYAANKNAAARRSTQPLPQQGASRGTQPGKGGNSRPNQGGPRTDPNRDQHEKAWEIAEKIFSGQNAE